MISFSFQAETLHLHNDVNLKKLFVTARYYTYKVLIKVDIGILALPIIDYLGRNCRCKIDMFCPKKVDILEEIGMLHNNLVYFSGKGIGSSKYDFFCFNFQSRNVGLLFQEM